MKATRKPEAPREETKKKMRPVKRDDFNELVQKAIRTPSRKPSAKAARPEERRVEN